MSRNRHLSWDDYLFQNRHKAYGAYALRTGEGQNLLKSLLIVVGFVGALIIALSFAPKEAEIKNHGGIHDPVIFEVTKIIDEQPQREIPVLPEVKKVIPPATTDEKLDSDIIPEPTSDPVVETPLNKNVNIGKTEIEDGKEPSEGMGASQIGSTTEGNNQIGTTDGTSPAVPETPAVPKKIFQPRDVAKMAVFPGCEKAGKSKEDFQNCLSKQLNRELGSQLDNFHTIAERYNIDKANTKLQFIVDTQGKIVQIKALGGNSPQFTQEAQAALKRIAEKMTQKGKFIQPAEMDDGTKVNMSFSVPVQFMIQ